MRIFFRNQIGSAVLAGMLGSMLVAGSAIVAYKNFNVTNDSLRVARVKSMIAVVEAQIRRRALQPEAYMGCTSNGTIDCEINPAFFSDLVSRPVVGARCATPGAGCGIQVSGISLVKATREFRAQISYAGKDARLKPTQVSIIVPVEILQEESFNCGALDPARPLFVGFDAAGRPDCRGFNACGPNQYVSGINVADHSVSCTDLPASVACAGGELFDNFNWAGGAIVHHCRPLADPPFRSALVVRRSVTGPPPDTTPPRIEHVVTTATTTVTAVSPSPSPVPAPAPTPTPNPAGLKWVNTSPYQRYCQYLMWYNGPTPNAGPEDPECRSHESDIMAGRACSNPGKECSTCRLLNGINSNATHLSYKCQVPTSPFPFPSP